MATNRTTRGRFIVFEGVEGSGKSTQVDLLAAALADGAAEVVVTREPGGTKLGKELRRLVMHTKDPVPTPTAELLLYLADRAQHLEDVIRPALRRRAVVICDRFSASTIVYQGFARGLDAEQIIRLDALVRKGLHPDLTIVLDCDVTTGLGRALDTDRFHEEDLGFHERVRRGFLELAQRDPDRHLVVDAAAEVAEVHALVQARVAETLR